MAKVCRGKRRRCEHGDAHFVIDLKDIKQDPSKFAKCSGCKVAVYCVLDCQLADWKARHKEVCLEAASEFERIGQIGEDDAGAVGSRPEHDGMGLRGLGGKSAPGLRGSPQRPCCA